MKLLEAILLCFLISNVTCSKESDKHGNPVHDKHYHGGEHDENYDHEAILGSDSDAEIFAHLSPEEAKSKLGEIFKKMDSSKDGFVDSKELVEWILKSFKKLNIEDTKEKMQSDDKDNDGMLTWDEIVESTYGMPELQLAGFNQDDIKDPESKKTMEKSLEYDKQKFKAADANGDGKLDVEEAAAYLHPYDYPRMADAETNRVLADYDKNNDGKISVEEYLNNAVFAEKPEDEMLGEKENFLHNDANGDGTLDKDEIAKWVSPDLEKTADEEAAHLMEQTDKNKDGQLSVEEVKDEHELWVGSEATDYGEMLHDEL